jgi:quinoprotein relay system zinc metallohydrolase 1
MKRPRPFLLALLLVLLCALPALLLAETAPRADPATLDYRLTARELAPGVFVVEGVHADFAVANGCNIINTGFVVTGAGVVVINTGPSRRYGEQLRALIARTTSEPLLRVVHLNAHPDYFLGNQAFADVPRAATPATRAAILRDAKAYEDNLYRLCGEWLRGTETLPPDTVASAGTERIGTHELEWHELAGHTDSDLVLVDRTAGVVFAGGLVFAERVPTTPHARLPAWRDSLDQLARWPRRLLVPSHGPVVAGADGIVWTRRYLDWLDQAFAAAAERGDEMAEVLRLPLPEPFRRWAAVDTEYVRNVAHLYPGYEQRALRLRPPR